MDTDYSSFIHELHLLIHKLHLLIIHELQITKIINIQNMIKIRSHSK
jgi:hypothetical protein